MQSSKYPAADDNVVLSVRDALIEMFQELSPQLALFFALPLVFWSRIGHELHHGGKSDKDALQNLRDSLLAANSALDVLSYWTATGLETALRRSYLVKFDEFNARDLSLPPTSRENFHEIISICIAATSETEEMWGTWRTDHGKSWNAISMIDEARRVWTAITGKKAPPKKLRRETKFADYLDKLLKSAGIHVSVTDAYDSWADIAYQEGSPLETPQKK
ncbi:MAG: hypothetical protein HKN18_06955 [Silicimonas sp.]|nr:hypothetical protein [Silicimonas sp.]